MRNRQRQRGLTMTGFIFTAIVAVTVLMIGFRTMPSYIEYFTVKKILAQILDSVQGGAITLPEVRRAFDRRIGADYIDSVAPGDVEMQKNGNQITLSASWTKTLHMVGNVSLLLEFEATATK
ncbi:MAG TPA: DUF4845 domain-containing protein [Casimicrobiaceae bacterium]|jgi:hypothetical protein